VILTGDVGGTKTALALFELREGVLVLMREAALLSREVPTLEDAVAPGHRRCDGCLEGASFAN
jgi:glucokinase